MSKKYYYFQETTKDWDAGYPVTNHVYVTTKDKRQIAGFINVDTLQWKLFRNPIPFNTKGRTFKLIKVTEVD